MKKIVLVFLMVFALCACAPKVTVKPIIEQESLLQYCEYDTPELKNFVLDQNGKVTYNGKEALNVLLQWQDYYNKCASMHDALVDTIKDLQKTK